MDDRHSTEAASPRRIDDRHSAGTEIDLVCPADHSIAMILFEAVVEEVD
jgi:hypothetical protein